tara:strand:+ start:126 stop:338 length:213 start_codon:yes stop_codon:yes gene_type:complete
MSKKILIFINNNKYEIDAGISLEELINSENISSDGIATAVNSIFVPKTERKKYIMQNTDSVTFFSAITGG